MTDNVTGLKRRAEILGVDLLCSTALTAADRHSQAQPAQPAQPSFSRFTGDRLRKGACLILAPKVGLKVGAAVPSMSR